MIDTLKHLDKFLVLYPTDAEKHAFLMGYISAKNGPNENNCHFTIFSNQFKAKAWEFGSALARSENET